jgi:catechol 2,3-dioxygenase-like lactoylglutathione lyase family enzyme
MSAPAPVTFGGINPILRVANLPASLAYYVDVLGFSVQWNYRGVIASVGRGKTSIFLCEGDQGHPGGWVWIGVDDVERLHEELVAKGARIRQAPTNFEWALEIQIEDLDGNVLRVGSDPKIGVPLGPWLDMHGRKWTAKDGGGWTERT